MHFFEKGHGCTCLCTNNMGTHFLTKFHGYIAFEWWQNEIALKIYAYDKYQLTLQ